MGSKRLYLVRHGVTAANMENRFAGRSDEPLHPEGIAQAEAVGRQLAGVEIGRICCGPMPRTRQTAEVIGKIIRAPVVSDDGLNEIAIPHWDGLTKDEIRQKFGEEYPTWLATPEAFQVPGCETIRDVQKRAVAAVEKLQEAATGNLLIVSHLIVVRCLLLNYRRLPLSDFRSIKVGNAEIVIV